MHQIRIGCAGSGRGVCLPAYVAFVTPVVPQSIPQLVERDPLQPFVQPAWTVKAWSRPSWLGTVFIPGVSRDMLPAVAAITYRRNAAQSRKRRRVRILQDILDVQPASDWPSETAGHLGSQCRMIVYDETVQSIPIAASGQPHLLA